MTPIARLGVRRILENQRDFNVVAEAATPAGRKLRFGMRPRVDGAMLYH